MGHRPQQAGCFAYFNILRFLGAFCIAVFLHYNDHFLPCLGIENPFSENPIAWAVSHNSSVFVEMYFIISGILFVLAYQKKIADGMSFDCFIIKRIVRIYPLMILTSIFMYIGNCLLYRYNGTLWSCGTLDILELLFDSLFGGKAVLNAAFTLNGPIWYINVLLICYVLAFFLTKISKTQRSVLVFIFPILLGLMIQYSGISFAIFNYSVSRGLISFFEGIILGTIFKAIQHRGGGGGIVGLRAAACIGLIMLLGVRLSPSYSLFAGNRDLFYTFLVFPFLLLLLYDCRWINKLCSSKLAIWLGNIAFSMYLWNFPIYLTLHLLVISGRMNVDVTSAWFLVIVSVIHLVAASISYYLIERKLTGKLAGLVDKVYDLSDVVYE